MNKIVTLSVRGAGIDVARAEVEKVLPVKLAAHESGYHGGGYFRGSYRECSLLLQENFLEDDGEKHERQFPLAELLLYVSGVASEVEAAVELLAQSGACNVLRSKVWESRRASQ